MYFINAVQVDCEMDLFIGRTASTNSPFWAVKIIFSVFESLILLQNLEQ